MENKTTYINKTLILKYGITNDYFIAGFPLSKLENRTLVLQVLDFDRFSKDDPIGEVEIQLGEINFYEPNIFHYYLSPCTGDRVRVLSVDDSPSSHYSRYITKHRRASREGVHL